MRPFFMDVRVVPTIVSKPEEVSMAPREEKKQKVLKAPKVELSEGIQAYDQRLQKPKVITGNPFDFNQVSLKVSKTASELVSDKKYNMIGKFLGIDTTHDWGKFYDKVEKITEWAKKNTQSDDINILIDWLGEKQRSLPNIGAKNIDNLYLFSIL